jgi:hypothetical protein
VSAATAITAVIKSDLMAIPPLPSLTATLAWLSGCGYAVGVSGRGR